MPSPESFTPPDYPNCYHSEPSVSFFPGQLVYYRKPSVVVELGSFVGWTSAHLALAIQANRQGHLYYLDSVPSNLDTAQANLKRLGLHNNTTPLLGGSLDASVIAKITDPITSFSSTRVTSTPTR